MNDLVVIGAGPGGYVAAIRAAQLGMKVAIAEERHLLGGTCLNVGCIPSKALLETSYRYHWFKTHAQKQGIEADPSLNFEKMMERKQGVVEGLTKGVAGLIQKNKIIRYEGKAAFLSPQEIQVGRERISGKRFLIATGSEPVALPFLSFDEKRVVSSTGALSLEKVPKKLAVIGAGVIGVELASVYARLGSEVTLIEMLEQVCPGTDPDISKNFQRILERQGLTFHLNSRLISDSKYEKEGKEHALEADVILVAIGRRAYTKGLGLEKTGIELNDQGMIAVDGNFCTNVPHIYAIGDVIEGPMLAHKASEEGVVAVERMAGMSSHINYMAIPSVIYTHPEVATVGLTKKETERPTFTGTFPFQANARARCAGDVDGMVKVIGDKETGWLIGMHIVGPNASEMIGEGVVAIESKMKVEELANAPHAHPTLSEAIKEACLNALGKTIHV